MKKETLKKYIPEAMRMLLICQPERSIAILTAIRSWFRVIIVYSLLVLFSHVSADERLPKKAAASINQSNTDAEIYLSPTVANRNHYRVAHTNISLPRSFQIESIIKPEAIDIGKKANFLFFIKYNNQFYMIDKDGKVEIYNGTNILVYDEVILKARNEKTLINFDLDETFEGSYEVLVGYQLTDNLDKIIFNSESAAMELRAYWSSEDSKIWKGSELEGRNTLCQRGAIRWNGPVINFDINLDSLNDFFMPISCYQADRNPNTLHNVKVQSSWKMFCSKTNDHHDDCTRDLFGSEFIDTTLDDTGGGNPYTHVMDKPRDLNGDGFPEFWYAMNRDDGKPGSIDYEDDELLESLCGKPEAWEVWQGRINNDCTRLSLHSILLSDSDGSYEVVPLNVWGRTVSHNMHVLPNAIGGYDFVIWGSPGIRAARLIDKKFIDVTLEYNNYVNGKTIESVPYYNRVIDHEDKTFLITPQVRQEFIDSPYKIEYGSNGKLINGFTLWEFRAGDGFYLSDYYTPTESENVTLKYREDGQVTEEQAVIIKGGIVFKPNWFFSQFEKLSSEEDSTLIMFQESDGGTTFGDQFKSTPDTSKTYTYYPFSENIPGHSQGEDPYLVTNQLNAVEGFYIKDGKLIAREKSVVEGDYVFNLVRMDFVDLNNDGFLDMLGEAGGTSYGSVYINDGNGTLQKLNTDAIWPFELNAGGNEVNIYSGRFFQPNSSKDTLDLIYYSRGWQFRPNYYSSDRPFVAGDIGILKGRYSIDSLPLKSVDEIQSDVGLCVTNRVWRGSCYFF
jgi:hypothetical protein